MEKPEGKLFRQNAPITEGRPAPKFYQGQQVSIRERPSSLTHSVVGIITAPPTWNDQWNQWQYKVRVTISQTSQNSQQGKDGRTGGTTVNQTSETWDVLEQSLLAG